MRKFLTALFAVIFVACSSDPATDSILETSTDTCTNPKIIDAPIDVTQFVAKADDFSCLNTATTDTDWYSVRNFLIKNELGRTQETLDVACGRKPAPYPIGTIVQLIPLEAMVKRGGDYAPDSNGWEFFALSTTKDSLGNVKTHIDNRGNTDTVNFAGANCFDCHRKAAPQFDLLCEQTNGCDPLGVDKSVIEAFRESDERCR